MVPKRFSTEQITTKYTNILCTFGTINNVRTILTIAYKMMSWWLTFTDLRPHEVRLDCVEVEPRSSDDKQMPDGVSTGDDAITLEEDDP